MKIFDLTHVLNREMTVFPGDSFPEISDTYSIASDGFAQKTISFSSHCGTHIDGPAHIYEDGLTLDKFPLSHFMGRAIVIDVSEVLGGYITADDLDKNMLDISEADFLIFNSGWYKKWGTPSYLYEYPVLSEDACRWICDRDLKGVGVDMISLDPVDSHELVNHKIILSSNMIIAENLTNIDLVGQDFFDISLFPLKIERADGSPVRAIGIIN